MGMDKLAVNNDAEFQENNPHSRSAGAIRAALYKRSRYGIMI